MSGTVVVFVIYINVLCDKKNKKKSCLASVLMFWFRRGLSAGTTVPSAPPCTFEVFDFAVLLLLLIL